MNEMETVGASTPRPKRGTKRRSDMPPRPPAALPALHGRHRTDDYAWLRDENWQQMMDDPNLLHPDIRAWLEAENTHKEAVLAPAKALRTTLLDELRARIEAENTHKEAALGPIPAKALRTISLDELHARTEAENTHEETVLGLAPAKALRMTLPDERQRRIAEDDTGHGKRKNDKCRHKEDRHQVNHQQPAGGRAHADADGKDSNPPLPFVTRKDKNDSESFTLQVHDLATGRPLGDPIERCARDYAWIADHETLFHTALDEYLRPRKILRHRLGTHTRDDAVVYEERDPEFFLEVAMTESRQLLTLSASSHTTSEVRLIDATRPSSTPILVAKREPGILYRVSHHADRLIILTNADGAEDFKIMETPVASPGRDNWVELIPHRPGIWIDSIMVYARWLVRSEWENALPRIVVRELASGEEHTIALEAFEEEAYSLQLLRGAHRFDTDILRLVYSSMATTERVYDYDMRTRERSVHTIQVVPNDHNPADYVTRRILAISHDGAMVPVSLLHHRETAIDGSAPLLLHGYGALGISSQASFDTVRLSLVDRGFVYAIAHVRGGAERGPTWHAEGRLARKTNSFHDFIAAAHALVEHGFTRPGRIAAHGASAGGMLVGACANMAPKLFHAVIAEVPCVDTLNTLCDDTLPLTPKAWTEWGNPLKSETDYDCIAAYSPYDNVNAKDYPHIIAIASLKDIRVPYWEPAKWVAKLRTTKTDDRLLVLHVNMENGHDPSRKSTPWIEETALVYAFVLHVFGIEDK